MKIEFTKKLLSWNREQNFREMPWKNETDAYRIWLSEIILQQTRVEQGLSYYKKFIVRFPTIHALAEGSEKEIFKCWEGLGYYSRCRNLIAASKKIASEYNGRFPSTYGEILSLPGVGPYTAAAIASFAFHLPHAVVDGNVERVLARYFGIGTIAGSAAGKKLFSTLAMELLDKKNPGSYNQAIMDFGATVCKPRQPLCSTCVQAVNCESLRRGWTNILPRKLFRSPKKERWFYYFILGNGKNRFWIRERNKNDIWKNLYEFALLETGQLIPQHQIKKNSFFLERFGNKGLGIKSFSPIFNQKLTHQSVTACFIHLDGSLEEFPGYQSITRRQMISFPFPKLIADYLKNYPL
jgi:A/G-specific adenine glycosylase